MLCSILLYRCFECECEITPEILGPKNLTKYQMFASQIERALGSAVSKNKKSSSSATTALSSFSISSNHSSSKQEQEGGGIPPMTASGVIVKGLRNLG